MQLSSSARKAVATGLAFSTLLWSVSLFVAPMAFAAPHSNGCLVNASGTVWLIENGMRRGFPSAEVFASHGYNFGQVVAANAEDTSLPVGSVVVYRDGTLVKGPSDPLVYLVANGQKRGFVSGSVFTGLGFSFANIWTAAANTFADLPTGANLESATERHSSGVLAKDGTGTVWWMTATGRKGIPTMEVFNSHGFNWAHVVNANAADLSAANEGVVTARPGCSDSQQPPVPTGNLSISTNAGTQASATVPKGATNVGFLKFNVMNTGSSAATLTSVTVKRTGAGSTSDFSNVYLYQGSSRLTSGRSVNSSTNEAIFSSLNVSIPASGSVTLDVVADIASGATAGNVHALGVSAAASGSTAASGIASGNNMTIAGVSAGSITAAAAGSPGNPKVGETNVIVAQFSLAAGSTEDLTVKRISLFNGGNINRSNLSNFKLMQNGVQVSSSTGFDSKDKVNFDLNFNLEKGNSRVFEVRADIVGAAKTSDTIKLYFEEASDLFAMGNTFGFGAAVTNNFGSGQGVTLTLQGGQLTLTFNGPASMDIAKDGKDVTLMDFTMTAQANVEVRQFSVIINNGGSGTANLNDGASPHFTDVKVWDTTSNVVVWGPQDLSGTGSDTSQDLLFTEDITLSAGQARNYRITTDVANLSTVLNDDVIGANIDVSDLSSQVKNLDNNTFMADADIVPNPTGSDIAGNQMKVKTNSLTVSLATTPTSQTFIKGTSNVPLVGFNLTAGTANDLRVNSIKVTCYIDSNDGNADFVKGEDADTGTVDCLETLPTIMLKVDGVQVGDTKSVGTDTDGTATFSNLNLMVSKGTTKTVVVYGNISSSAFRNGNSERVAFDIVTASTDVNTTDSNGNDVSESGDATNGGTSPNRIITIANTGTLTVANAPTEIDVTDARVVAAGLSGVTTQKLRFTAQNEEMKVTKMRIGLASAAAGADIADNVVSVELYDGATRVAGPSSPTTGCASGTLDACVDFNTISPDFVVPKDGDRTLTVKVNMNTVSGGADSGDELGTLLDFDTNFEARGTAGSTVATTVGSADVAGNKVVVRKSQPKVELVSLPSSILSVGTVVAYKFKITAMDGNVAFKHLEFTTLVSDDTNTTLSAPALRESGQTTDLAATVAITDGASTPSDITLSSEQQISAGTSKTYEFRLTVGGAPGAGDNIATSIDDGATTQVTGELSTSAADQTIDDLDNLLDVGDDTDTDAVQNFIWSDMSAIPHNDTHDGTDDTDGAASNDWTSGRLLRIPTDTQSLIFPS